jgi:hypothetical protein
MNNALVLNEQRRRVRGLITLFLKEMKSRKDNSKYYGTDTQTKNKFYSRIEKAYSEINNRLNNDSFFNLNKDQLFTIEKILTENISRLEFNLSGLLNFTPNEDLVIPGIKEYKEYNSARARVPLYNEDIPKTRKAIKEEIFYSDNISQKQTKEFPIHRDYMLNQDNIFTDITEDTFTTIDGKKIDVIRKTRYIEYTDENNAIKSWGSLVNSLANVLSNMKGESITPEDVDKAMDNAGAYRMDSNLYYSDILTNKYGLSAKREDVSQTPIHAILKKIDDTITIDKRPVIIMLGNQSNGHFAVITGIRYDDYGNATHYIINDPTSNSAGGRYLDRETLSSEENKSKRVTAVISLSQDR